MFVFIIFFGLRGFIYTDWIGYYSFFEDLPSLIDANKLHIINSQNLNQFGTQLDVSIAGMEYGFIYFTSLCKTITSNYFIWVFFNTFIDLILLDLFIRRYSKYYVLGFILFFVFGGLGIEINLMRNVKAIFLFLISLEYLKKRKLIPYMLLNLLGYLFHSSAIVFFPLYFILHKEWNKKLLLIIFILGNIIYLFQINFIEPIILQIVSLIGGRMELITRLYFENDYFSRPFGIGLGFIERTFTFILIYLYSSRLKKQDTNNIIFINMYVIYIIIYLYLSEISVAVERLSLLFIGSYWILYPNILNLLRTRNYRLNFLSPLLFYCILKLTLANSHVFAKYDNLLFGIENYQTRSQRVYSNLDKVLNN